MDTASGKLARRPELDKALLSANRPGDQLVVTKLDRLGRSLEHLIELAKQLEQRGVDLVVLDQGIDTSTALGRLFFQIIGAIAEFEHALMSERTMDGLAAARARGRTGGQKPKLGPRQVKLAREMYDETGPDGKRRHTVAADRCRVRRQPPDDLPPPRAQTHNAGPEIVPGTDSGGGFCRSLRPSAGRLLETTVRWAAGGHHATAIVSAARDQRARSGTRRRSAAGPLSARRDLVRAGRARGGS